MPIALWSEETKNLIEDLSPDQGFGHEVDLACQELEKATSGFFADKGKAIENLAPHDPLTRTRIYRRYKELYGTDLGELMAKKFSGDLGNALEFLAYPPDMAECAMLHKAMKGIGCSVNIVYSILCGRTNYELERIKKTYFNMYTKDLGKQVASELHGNMERLVFNSMQASQEPYDPQYHTADKAVEDAEKIYAMSLAKWGTDEKGIFKILCASPPEHLENVNKIFADKYGYSLWKAMEKELSGNLKDGTLYMVGMKTKPYDTMALLVKQACAGFGTDEMLLTCCIIRYQDIIKGVMISHMEQFGKTIHERVRSETSGHYKDVLLAALNTVWPEEGS